MAVGRSTGRATLNDTGGRAGAPTKPLPPAGTVSLTSVSSVPARSSPVSLRTVAHAVKSTVSPSITALYSGAHERPRVR